MIFCLWIVPHAPTLPCACIYHALYPYHVVAPRLSIMWLLSHLRFLPENWKPGSESEHQKELIGTVFMSHASNLRLEQYFDNVFFENTLFGPFTLKYTFYKNCHFSLSSTVARTLWKTGNLAQPNCYNTNVTSYDCVMCLCHKI